MPVLKCLYALLQKLTRPLDVQWLRSNSFNLLLGHTRDNNRRKDVLEATNHVPLDHLSGDICDECFDLDL